LTSYAAATLEELWSSDRLVERRLSFGRADVSEGRFVASDVRPPELVELCERALDEVRAHCVAADRRLVVEATEEGVAVIVVLRDGNCSVVTDLANFDRDLELLRSIAGLPPESAAMDPHSYPLVWRNGTAAVLLHEAVGHGREVGQPEEAWPDWLQIEIGFAERRASFRDVPLRRMTHLTARQTGAPSMIPDARIEVLLVEGGAYDPLTGLVSVRISAADFIDRDATPVRLPPFVFSAHRERIARSVVAAHGEPIRYPGVICSREGQQVFVSSAAPLLVTERL
jgi:hypothetical protein